MSVENLAMVPELDIEALPVARPASLGKSLLREAPLFERAEITHVIGVGGGFAKGAFTTREILCKEMRYVLGRDTPRGRLYASDSLSIDENDKVKFDPDLVHGRV